MDSRIKEFIENNIDLIENNEWEEVYLNTKSDIPVGELTTTLLEAGIDPLNYLNYIPYKYMVLAPIKEFKIPTGITSIGDLAFFSCINLTSITIPDGVMSIGEGAFEDCSSLTSVTIGNSVTSIEKYAFWDCSSLTNIAFNGTKAEWNAIEKGENWKFNVPATVIQCKDEDINIK
jgi:hypothetical protein